MYRSTQKIHFVIEIHFFNFKTLSRVHVYRIKYLWYRQGPYRIRIVSAADRIVTALVLPIVVLLNFTSQCKA